MNDKRARKEELKDEQNEGEKQEITEGNTRKSKGKDAKRKDKEGSKVRDEDTRMEGAKAR